MCELVAACAGDLVEHLCLIHSFVPLVLSIPVAPEAAISDSQKPIVTISEGASIAVMCTATGVPAPTISWFLDGVLLINDNATLFITSSTNETLATFCVTSTISPSIVTRDGAFATITCTASNEVGTISSDSTQLIVLCKSVIEDGMIEAHTLCMKVMIPPLAIGTSSHCICIYTVKTTTLVVPPIAVIQVRTYCSYDIGNSVGRCAHIHW